MHAERCLVGVRRGFTLIELLVVVAIIALLISILLPSLGRAREQTRQVICSSNLRGMGQAIALYQNDWNGSNPGPIHPPIYREGGDALYNDPDAMFEPLGPGTREWYLITFLAPMMGDDGTHEFSDKLATCPTAQKVNPDANFDPDQLVKDGTPHRPFHYLPNSWPNTDPDHYFGWTNIGASWQGVANAASFRRPKKIEQIPLPANEWAIGDAWTQKLPDQFIRPGVFADGQVVGTWQIDPDVTSSDDPLPTTPVHGERDVTVLLFFDGHAEKYKGIETWWIDLPGNPSEALLAARNGD